MKLFAPLRSTLKIICIILTTYHGWRWVFRKKNHVKMDLHESTPLGFWKTFSRVCTHTLVVRVLNLIYVGMFLSIASPRYLSICLLWIKYLCTVCVHICDRYFLRKRTRLEVTISDNFTHIIAFSTCVVAGLWPIPQYFNPSDYKINNRKHSKELNWMEIKENGSGKRLRHVHQLKESRMPGLHNCH